MAYQKVFKRSFIEELEEKIIKEKILHSSCMKRISLLFLMKIA